MSPSQTVIRWVATSLAVGEMIQIPARARHRHLHDIQSVTPGLVQSIQVAFFDETIAAIGPEPLNRHLHCRAVLTESLDLETSSKSCSSFDLDMAPAPQWTLEPDGPSDQRSVDLPKRLLIHRGVRILARGG